MIEVAPYLVPQPNIPPALEPIATEHSEVVTALEHDLQEAFIAVFQAAIRPRLRRLAAYGMPHRAEFEALERFVKSSGLAIDRRTAGEDAMRQIFRAWTANNPRRGLAFLRLCLMLLYPGVHTADQLWQDPNREYPGGASPATGPTKWLTSRARVTIDAEAGLTAEELVRARSIMLSIVPARIVLEMSVDLGDPIETQVAIAAAASAEQVFSLQATI
jgi:hypothetical protein